MMMGDWVTSGASREKDRHHLRECEECVIRLGTREKSRVKWLRRTRDYLHVFVSTVTKRGNQSLFSFLSLTQQGKRKKGNLAAERTRELDTQILYTIHDLPTNHGIPPTGAMQNSYQRGKENPGNGGKKAVRA
jgi:hypothetical protein